MDDLISRKALLAEYDRVHVGPPGGARKLIEDAPVIDAVPVVHGRCPYCDSENNDFIPLNQSVEYSGIEMALNRQGMLRVRYYMYNGVDHFESQDIVNIKFCPNCGRAMNGRTNSVETIGFADESGLASAT